MGEIIVFCLVTYTYIYEKYIYRIRYYISWYLKYYKAFEKYMHIIFKIVDHKKTIKHLFSFLMDLKNIYAWV